MPKAASSLSSILEWYVGHEYVKRAFGFYHMTNQITKKKNLFENSYNVIPEMSSYESPRLKVLAGIRQC